MYKNILLAAALQHWERYSAHALAARDVAAALARHAKQLHVLSVYEHEARRLPSSNLPAEMAANLREQLIQETDHLMAEKLDEYVAPLVSQGIPVSKILRLGSPRHLIVEVASETDADLLVIGSHSKRRLFDIALGDTARHVNAHAPCTVLMVAPRKQQDRSSTGDALQWRTCESRSSPARAAASIATLFDVVKKTYGRIDLLFNDEVSRSRTRALNVADLAGSLSSPASESMKSVRS
jgi:nucleotide-binding universal stress UspA family protein